jgi:Mg2+ and Co2+ transporter CorA
MSLNLTEIFSNYDDYLAGIVIITMFVCLIIALIFKK